MIYWLRNFLFGLFRPPFWFMANPYDSNWDENLNKLLDEHRFYCIGEYTADLGGAKIWIASYPFGSMRPYFIEVRPSRLTVHRAMKHLQRDMLEENKSKVLRLKTP